MTRATIPSNHVMALVRGAASAVAVAEELRDHGLESPLIVSGERLSDRLEAESGLVTRALQRLFGHLSEQTDYLHQYEEAVRRGNTVVAVRAEDDHEVQVAKQVFDKHGAADVRFFGQLAVRDLTPDSNPSAASDEIPSRRPVEHS
jgi:hypothetical protein